jgi:hypothetical protein
LKPDKDEVLVIKEEPSFRFHWCAVGFITCYFLSWAIPGLGFFFYIFYYFLPYCLETDNIITLFTELDPLISFLSFPLVLVFSYILHIIIAAMVTKFWYWVSEQIIPSKEGIIPRNIPSKTLNLYHIRSFILKYPKNALMKGLFPWLFTWVFNFIGSTNYGKGTTIEEEVLGDKFVDTGKNCYISPNASLASHLVEGIFGNIYYFKIKLGENVTIGPEVPLGPGTHLEDNSYIFPLGAALKFTENKGNYYYFGMPIRRLFSRKLKDYLQISDEDLKKAEELAQKYQNEK